MLGCCRTTTLLEWTISYLSYVIGTNYLAKKKLFSDGNMDLNMLPMVSLFLVYSEHCTDVYLWSPVFCHHLF